MANLKNITELPMAESAEGLNLIVNDNGSAKQIAASAVGAQADWNEKDENSASYIKNRPFWTGETNYVTLLDKLVLNFSSTGFYGQKSIDPIEIIENEKYFITFDDEQYECIAFHHDYGNCASLGDENRMNGSGEGLPFFITNSGGYTVVFSGITGEHTISIVKETVDIHKIDEKYLPEKVFLNVISDFNPSTDFMQYYKRNDPVYVKNSPISGNTTDYRDNCIALQNDKLVLPSENFAYMVKVGSYIDISNTAKGESIVQQHNRSNGGNRLHKAHTCWDSIISASLIDNGVVTSFFIFPETETTVITSEGKVCRISSKGNNLYDYNWSVDITVTVLGTITLS